MQRAHLAPGDRYERSLQAGRNVRLKLQDVNLTTHLKKGAGALGRLRAVWTRACVHTAKDNVLYNACASSIQPAARRAALVPTT